MHYYSHTTKTDMHIVVAHIYSFTSHCPFWVALKCNYIHQLYKQKKSTCINTGCSKKKKKAIMKLYAHYWTTMCYKLNAASQQTHLWQVYIQNINTKQLNRLCTGGCSLFCDLNDEWAGVLRVADTKWVGRRGFEGDGTLLGAVCPRTRLLGCIWGCECEKRVWLSRWQTETRHTLFIFPL